MPTVHSVLVIFPTVHSVYAIYPTVHSVFPHYFPLCSLVCVDEAGFCRDSDLVAVLAR